jgi:hypothetical protein
VAPAVHALHSCASQYLLGSWPTGDSKYGSREEGEMWDFTTGKVLHSIFSRPWSQTYDRYFNKVLPQKINNSGPLRLNQSGGRGQDQSWNGYICQSLPSNREQRPRSVKSWVWGLRGLSRRSRGKGLCQFHGESQEAIHYGHVSPGKWFGSSGKIFGTNPQTIYSMCWPGKIKLAFHTTRDWKKNLIRTSQTAYLMNRLARVY